MQGSDFLPRFGLGRRLVLSGVYEATRFPGSRIYAAKRGPHPLAGIGFYVVPHLLGAGKGLCTVAAPLAVQLVLLAVQRGRGAHRRHANFTRDIDGAGQGIQ